MYVWGLVSVFVLTALGLMVAAARTASQQSVARASIGQTFVHVDNRQNEFRSTSGRFATWDELRANGARLGPSQVVAASNADASHWFISIRDQKTGLICDRIGSLTEGMGTRKRPECREP